ncbi:hypothetical protein V2L60_15145, partial [Staphylococcus gallinarum]
HCEVADAHAVRAHAFGPSRRIVDRFVECRADELVLLLFFLERQGRQQGMQNGQGEVRWP